jgi:hypothetical protein
LDQDDSHDAEGDQPRYLLASGSEFMAFEEEEEGDEDEEGATTADLSQAPWRETLGEDDLCHDTIESEESRSQDQIDLTAQPCQHR